MDLDTEFNMSEENEENVPYMLDHPYSINDNSGTSLKIGGINNNNEEKKIDDADGDTPIINIE